MYDEDPKIFRDANLYAISSSASVMDQPPREVCMPYVIISLETCTMVRIFDGMSEMRIISEWT